MELAQLYDRKRQTKIESSCTFTSHWIQPIVINIDTNFFSPYSHVLWIRLELDSHNWREIFTSELDMWQGDGDTMACINFKRCSMDALILEMKIQTKHHIEVDILTYRVGYFFLETRKLSVKNVPSWSLENTVDETQSNKFNRPFPLSKLAFNVSPPISKSTVLNCDYWWNWKLKMNIFLCATSFWLNNKNQL